MTPLKKRAAVYLAVDEERARQERLFPRRTCASRRVGKLRKLRVLMEEVGEVAEALDPKDANTKRDLRAELTQVAAVAIAWLEALG